MAKTFTVYDNAIVKAIEWDSIEMAAAHKLVFTADGEEHEVVFQFDPIITHVSAPKNRLHRWLLQPGAVINLRLPKSATDNIRIEIDQYADSQYIPGVYTNHEGKTELRSMVPLRVRFEATKWHGLAHTITGWDRDRQAERSYELAEWDFTADGIARFNEISRQFAREIARDQREQCAGNPIIPVGSPL